jgi:hypothetical protein
MHRRSGCCLQAQTEEQQSQTRKKEEEVKYGEINRLQEIVPLRRITSVVYDFWLKKIVQMRSRVVRFGKARVPEIKRCGALKIGCKIAHSFLDLHKEHKGCDLV